MKLTKLLLITPVLTARAETFESSFNNKAPQTYRTVINTTNMISHNNKTPSLILCSYIPQKAASIYLPILESAPVVWGVKVFMSILTKNRHPRSILAACNISNFTIHLNINIWVPLTQCVCQRWSMFKWKSLHCFVACGQCLLNFLVHSHWHRSDLQHRVQYQWQEHSRGARRDTL